MIPWKQRQENRCDAHMLYYDIKPLQHQEGAPKKKERKKKGIIMPCNHAYNFNDAFDPSGETSKMITDTTSAPFRRTV